MLDFDISAVTTVSDQKSGTYPDVGRPFLIFSFHDYLMVVLAVSA
jgi:hypothetical protein